MSRFKVGDKVRYIGSDSTWDADDNEIAYWMEGIVSDPNDDGEVKVSFVRRFCDNIDPEDLELVAPADPKREFLERLQSLLREFDAHINISWNDYFDSDGAPCIDMDICFGDGTGVDFENVLDYTITPDNIMDFDKE